MNINRLNLFSFAFRASCVLLSGLLGAATASAASPEKVIHNFESNSGAYPWSSLVFDAGGNLYGTTESGGSDTCSSGCGTVFELTPRSHGGWTYRVIYPFRGGFDGVYPTFSSALVLDQYGNIYGTTLEGGEYGRGTAFKLTHNSNGSWSENIIHSFAGQTAADGDSPESGLIFDPFGNLYGTTEAGGLNGQGCVYELIPTSNGWTEQILYSFAGPDGLGPVAPVIIDSVGNLYGTASGGGPQNFGVVFELSSNASGSWTESVLYSFAGGAGHGNPLSGLFLDGVGNLYGTVGDNGFGAGAVFELVSNLDGSWTESVIHSFGTDGSFPRSGLLQDSNGSLYGTTNYGGPNGGGTVYKLIPNSNGTSTERVLYNFTEGADGDGPIGSVALDQTHHLYGTTAGGGSGNVGVVFEVQ